MNEEEVKLLEGSLDLKNLGELRRSKVGHSKYFNDYKISITTRISHITKCEESHIHNALLDVYIDQTRTWKVMCRVSDWFQVFGSIYQSYKLLKRHRRQGEACSSSISFQRFIKSGIILADHTRRWSLFREACSLTAYKHVWWIKKYWACLLYKQNE